MDSALLDTDILSEVLKLRDPLVRQKTLAYAQAHGRPAFAKFPSILLHPSRYSNRFHPVRLTGNRTRIHRLRQYDVGDVGRQVGGSNNGQEVQPNATMAQRCMIVYLMAR